MTDINTGLDQDMNNDIKVEDVWNKHSLMEVPEEDMNKPIYRILTSMMKVGIFDDKNTNKIDAIVTNDEHKKIAKEINEQSIILLKNDKGALPLNNSTKQQLLILGEDDMAYTAMSHGNGSGVVHSSYVQSPLFEFCDRFNVERFGNITDPETKCNAEKGNCITYGGK